MSTDPHQQDPADANEEENLDKEGVDSLSPLKGEKVSPKSLSRRTSLGMSLVGSIRSLNKRPLLTSMSPTKPSKDDCDSPTKDAREIPLPSSPIQIPQPPALSLDLGPTALVSPTFGRFSPDMTTKFDSMKLTNSPATEDITKLGPEVCLGGSPQPQHLPYSPRREDVEEEFSNILARIKAKPSSYILSEEEFAILESFPDRFNDNELAQHAVARYWGTVTNPAMYDPASNPPSYLHFADKGTRDEMREGTQHTTHGIDGSHISGDGVGRSPAAGPSTPLPGTGQGFDFDGANDSTELFERSVEYKDKTYKKESRRLKKMTSLDAMAEECATSSPSESRL